MLHFFPLLLLFFTATPAAHAQSAACDTDPTDALPAPFNETAFLCTPVWNNFIMRYAVSEGNTLTIVLSALYTSGWVGMGFSDDGMMVGSTAMAGWVGRDRKPHIRQYYLGGQTRSKVKVRNTGLSITDDIRLITIYGPYLFLAFQVTFPVPITKHWLLFAYSAKPPHRTVLSEHQARSSIYFDFVAGNSTESSYPYKLRRTHGVLAIVGWGILLPIGALIARHCKKWDPLWFYLHMATQFSGYIIGVAAVVVGVSLYDKLHGPVPAHRGLGIFVLVLGSLQVLAFFLRPSKDSKYRRYWNWYHHWFGRFTLLFGAINIVVGIQVAHAGEAWKIGYGIGLFIILLISIVLEIMPFMRTPKKSLDTSTTPSF